MSILSFGDFFKFVWSKLGVIHTKMGALMFSFSLGDIDIRPKVNFLLLFIIFWSNCNELQCP